jgi:hypothetical protein
MRHIRKIYSSPAGDKKIPEISRAMASDRNWNMLQEVIVEQQDTKLLVLPERCQKTNGFASGDV